MPSDISWAASPAAASSASLPSAAELAEALGEDDASGRADALYEGVVSADWLAELVGTGAGVVACSAGAEQLTRATAAAVAAVNANGLTKRVMEIFMMGLLLVVTNVSLVPVVNDAQMMGSWQEDETFAILSER